MVPTVTTWCRLGVLVTALATTPGRAAAPDARDAAELAATPPPLPLLAQPTTATSGTMAPTAPAPPPVIDPVPFEDAPEGHDDRWRSRLTADDSRSAPLLRPGLRLSGYASFAHTRVLSDSRHEAAFTSHDSHLRVLQLRLLGSVPEVDRSFLLVAIRAEQTPRLSYALVRLPLGRHGHYLALDSGATGLSVARATSVAKHLMLDPPYHVVNAFEQPITAALELGGPLDASRRLLWRLFVGGGSGGTATTVSVHQLPAEQRNSSWTVGSQLFVSAIGVAHRFDSQLLYEPAPPTLALYAGARYDERRQERFPAANVGLVAKAGRLFLASEVYAKQELVFRSTQLAYLVTLGGLVLPRRLLLGAEYGAYLAGELRAPPPSPADSFGIDVAAEHDEAQLRAVCHLYVGGGAGVISGRYVLRDLRQGRLVGDGFRREELLLAASVRF